MKVFFDTSALVTAVVDQLPNHAAALACYRQLTRSRRGKPTAFCSTHAIAECYATLTALPLQRRIAPFEAARLIEQNFLQHLAVSPLSLADYEQTIARVSSLGLASGAVYDALHVRCALEAGCSRIITYNTGDFTRLVPPGIEVVTP